MILVLAQTVNPVESLSTGSAQTILATVLGVLALAFLKVVHYHVVETKAQAKERADERAQTLKERAEERAALLAKLEKSETERREEAERLLREQKDILREVMVTTQSLGGNLEENTKAMERLIAMVEKLSR